jgi:hypothetical protein
MFDYDQIIARTASQKLNIGRPRLQLLPPPVETQEPDESFDPIAWAKALHARGIRFRGSPVAAPAPRRRAANKLQQAAHEKILAALPATINDLVPLLSLSKPTLHKRLLELQLAHRAHPVRRPGRGGGHTWHPTTSTPPAPGTEVTGSEYQAQIKS